MKKRYFILLVFIFETSIAQNYHFSNFGFLPLNYNPSNTNFQQQDLLVSAVHRSQYRSIPTDYSTTGISIASFKKNKNGYFQFGLNIVSDRAGDLSYSINEVSPFIGFQKPFKNRHLLSLSVMPSLRMFSIDRTKVSFEDQLLTGNSSADLNGLPPNYFNFRNLFGIGYQYVNTEKISNINFAFASNINLMESNFKNNLAELNDNFHHLNAGLSYSFSSENKLHFKGLYTFHKSHRNIVNGVIFSKDLNSFNENFGEASLGVLHRLNDAMIFQVSMGYRNYVFALAYDVGVGEIKQANNGRGAFEICLLYSMKKIKIDNVLKKVCPVFL